MEHFTKAEKVVIDELLEVLMSETDSSIEFLVNGLHFDEDEINEMGCCEIFDKVQEEIQENNFETIKEAMSYIIIDEWDMKKMEISEDDIQDGKIRKPCKNPCPTCPYTKNAIKGYFGGQNSDVYANAINQDTVIACHSRTKHDKMTSLPNSLDDVTICTGHIVSQIKSCKSSQHPDGKKAQEQLRNADNFEELKENALAFDFRTYHGID